MTVIARRTTVACNLVTGTQDIMIPALGGLTPKAAHFILTKATADGVPANGAAFAEGVATGATARWAICGTSAHAQATTISTGTFLDVACIFQVDPDSVTLECAADFDSFITNGVRIDWDTAPPAGFLLTVTLYAGDELQAQAGNTSLGNTNNLTTDINTVGFQPDVVLFGMARPDDRLSIGMAHEAGGTVTQRAYGWVSRNNVGAEAVAAYARDDAVLLGQGTGGVLNWYVTASDFDANGFSVTTLLAGAGNTVAGWLALDFGGVGSWVGTYTTPTVTGDHSSTGPGFEPQYIQQIQTLAEATNTNYTNDLAGSFALAVMDSAGANSISHTREDTADPTNTQSLNDDIAVNVPADDGTALITATLASLNADGWTYNYSATAAASKLFWTLAIEESAVAGGDLGPGSSAGSSTATGTLKAKGSLSGAISSVATVLGTLVGAGFLLAALNGQATASATLTPVTSLEASAAGSSSVSGQLSAIGRLEGSTSGTGSSTADISAVGSLQASAVGQATASATLHSESSISGLSSGTSTVSASLRASAYIASTVSGSAVAQADLSAKGYLTSLSEGSSSVQADLVGKIYLSGSAAGQSTVSGNIFSSEPIIGSASGLASVSGQLSAKAYLIGLSEGSSTASLRLGSTIEGSVSGTSTVSATLVGAGYLEGSASGLTTLSANLSASGTLSASAGGTSTAIATLVGSVSLSGSSAGSATVGADLRAAGYLVGLSSGEATTEGTLNRPTGSIVGSSTGDGAASGTLSARGFLSGIATGSSTVGASLVGSFSIQGQADGLSSHSATLSAFGNLAGVISASSTVDGTLTSVSDSSIVGLAQGTASVQATLFAAGYLSGIASGSSVAVLVTEEVEDTSMLSAGVWKKNQPNTILFVLVDSDGVEVSGLGSSFTVQLSKAGSAFQASVGTKSEIGLGWYRYTSTAAEADTSGPVAIVITDASILQQNLEYIVEDRVITAVEFTYTVTSSAGGLPIEGVYVAITADSAGISVVWTGYTDAFGVARDTNGRLPRLDPGDYFFFRQRAGYVFSDPDEETVGA